MNNRNFLLLEPSLMENTFVSKVLKSPLELAEMLIYSMFTGQYTVTTKSLDDIKLYAAGLNRAKILETDYSLAKYSLNQFTLQQFFHNSFKARQGKVLEAIMQYVLFEYNFCDEVPEKPSNNQVMTKRIFELNEVNKNDIDVLGYNSKNKKYVAIQLRSRDNTGGTTAKGSLADWIKPYLTLKHEPIEPLIYIIGIWEGMDGQQKNSTISKLWTSLEKVVSDEMTKDNFYSNIEKGIFLTSKIKIQLCYGYDSILDTIFNWFMLQDITKLKAISTTIRRLMNWDDMWVSYAIASLEIGNNLTNKINNIEILNSKIPNSIFNGINMNNIHTFVNDLTIETAKDWKENNLPMPSISENFEYLSDLIFLKAIFSKFNNSTISKIKANIKKIN